MIALLLATMLLIPPSGDATPDGEVTLELDPARHAIRGEPDAPVIIVEFSDFKCHACEKFSLTIMPNLQKEFIEPGDLKVAFVDFPLLDQDHYTTVAEAVHCAGEQGEYWTMHDTLWTKIGALSDQHLLQYASELGLEVPPFRRCLEEDRFRQRILDDLRFTYELGLSSRPTFFVGRREPAKGENAYVGRYIEGAQSYILYKSVIRKMLAAAPQGP